MLSLLALFQPGQPWDLGSTLIAIVILCAAVAIAWLAIKFFGVSIPPIVVQIFWIVVICIIAIIAIRFVLTL